MEEVSLITKIFLVLLFSSSMAYSYYEYEERLRPTKRFSAALEFSDVLKNHYLCLKVGDMPNPGLLEQSHLQKFSYKNLSKLWNKPYKWEVVVKNDKNEVIFREGDLKKEGKNQTYLTEKKKEFTSIYAMVAVKGEDKITRPGRLEVWVWDS